MQFKAWLEGHFPTLLPQGPLAQAFGYALSNWQALTRFTEAGFLAPDTNLVERTIRPIAVGRKAWLFAGSTRGGDAAAVGGKQALTITVAIPRRPRKIDRLSAQLAERDQVIGELTVANRILLLVASS